MSKPQKILGQNEISDTEVIKTVRETVRTADFGYPPARDSDCFLIEGRKSACYIERQDLLEQFDKIIDN